MNYTFLLVVIILDFDTFLHFLDHLGSNIAHHDNDLLLSPDKLPQLCSSLNLEFFFILLT